MRRPRWYKVSGIGIYPYPYFYAWGNNEKRATLKGRRMQVIARGAMNSALVEFENGQREIISRNAIRKVKADQEAR